LGWLARLINGNGVFRGKKLRMFNRLEFANFAKLFQVKEVTGSLIALFGTKKTVNADIRLGTMTII
jgi:hypothetical protein